MAFNLRIHHTVSEQIPSLWSRKDLRTRIHFRDGENLEGILLIRYTTLTLFC